MEVRESEIIDRRSPPVVAAKDFVLQIRFFPRSLAIRLPIIVSDPG